MAHRRYRTGFSLVAILILLSQAVFPQNSPGGVEPLGITFDVDFDKAFAPSTIGPGSTTKLTFTITNNESVGITDMTFTDTLPTGTTIATPSSASTTCVNGVLSAPDGGSTIGLSGGDLGVGLTCTIEVNVTATMTGMNTSGSLSFTLSGSSESVPGASDTLTVDTGRPGFFKAFSPSIIPPGATSTLTFTIDNTDNDAPEATLTFADTLPGGLVIASPANAFTDCGATFSPSITADPGTSFISFSALGSMMFPAVPAMDDCIVSVDVTNSATGVFDNVSDELLSDDGTDSSGFATASLEVPVDTLNKAFTDDPAVPGGTVNLRFTIVNLSRDASATDIEFDDDLDDALMGLVATGTPLVDVCGTGSTLTGTDLLEFSGGSLSAGGSCVFDVTLAVPVGAAAGDYTNTTTAIMLERDMVPFVGNMATDILTVEPRPVLTKEFTDDPAASGGTVTLKFTITNTTDEMLTDLAFTDDLNEAIEDLAANGLVSGGDPDPLTDICGMGSELTVSDPFPMFVDPDPTMLIFSGGSLAPAGMPGDSCMFSVVLDIPAGVPSGGYLNTTSDITGEDSGGPVTGRPGRDTLIILGAPRLRKEFTDDPAQPGGTVTLEFKIENRDPVNAASDITFSDNLDAALTGLVATGLPISACGGTLSGTSTVTLTGGSLAANDLVPGSGPDECTFSVTLDVPAGAPIASHTNTTTEIMATVDGKTATGLTASDDLRIAGLTLTKEFIDDPVPPGGTVDLKFTIKNISSTATGTAITFSDNLDDVVSGLSGDGVAASDVCGPGNGSISWSASDTMLTFSGGSLGPGEMCMFTVTLDVPGGATEGNYPNLTTGFSAVIDGGPGATSFDNAVGTLIVDKNLLSLTKEFTDDPVEPGGTVTLKFTLENLDPDDAASAIAFMDDLDAALSGLLFDSLLSSTCGGTVSGTGTGTVDVSGASLAAGGTCTIEVAVTVPGGAPLGSVALNTTDEVSGTIGGVPVTGAEATDALTIDSDLLSFSKAFTDDPTTATGTVTLEFTITNLSGSLVSDISFSDDLSLVIPGLTATTLPPAGVCGAGSTLTGTSLLLFSGGSLPAGPGSFCVIPVTLTLPITATAGTFSNTSSALRVSGIDEAAPASDTLTVEPPPVFSKAFMPSSIAFGATSTLVFTINNSASSVAVSGLMFEDILPAGVAVADGSAAACGGTVTTTAATRTIDFSGGTLGAGGSCMISVTVTGIATGTHVNTTSEDLMSSSGNSGSASASLIVGTEPGTIIITKGTSPAGGTGFGFTHDIGGGGSFTLDDGASETFVGVAAPGGYSVTETDPSGLGFALTGLTCVDSDTGGTPSSTSLATRTASIMLDPGETVTCTYTNTMGATCFTDTTGTSTGEATICFTGSTGALCGFDSISFIPLEGDPLSPPADTAPDNFDFLHGLVSFTITNCTPGFTADLTWQLPAPLPVGTIFWKYGPTPGDPTDQWYQFPATVAGDTITFSIVDGGLGDDDLTVNGTIIDQAGPAAPNLTSIAGIPTLSEWSLMLLAILLAAAGVWWLRRREARV